MRQQVVGGLTVDGEFFRFVEDELLPLTDLAPGDFWSGLESLIDDLTPINRDLLRVRDEIQFKIDEWHRAHQGQDWNHAEYVEFLQSIAYLRESGEAFHITTESVDAEISEIAGPQLVVPVNNARFAINAANAPPFLASSSSSSTSISTSSMPSIAQLAMAPSHPDALAIEFAHSYNSDTSFHVNNENSTPQTAGLPDSFDKLLFECDLPPSVIYQIHMEHVLRSHRDVDLSLLDDINSIVHLHLSRGVDLKNSKIYPRKQLVKVLTNAFN